jgi:hypothetical protein
MHLSLTEWRQEGVQGPPESQTPLLPQQARKAHTPGEMNGLEKRYAQHLGVRKATGEVLDWRFEPLKLLLAPKATFTGDFVVKTAAGLELHETKGWWEEDARLKMKWAAKDFRWMFSRIVGVKWDAKRKDWQYEEF